MGALKLAASLQRNAILSAFLSVKALYPLAPLLLTLLGCQSIKV